MVPSLVDSALNAMQDDLAEIYPPGQPMTFWRLSAERTALRSRLEWLEQLRATCTNCRHFAGVRGFNRCTLFDEEPPEAFRTDEGKCESWIHDGVPF